MNVSSLDISSPPSICIEELLIRSISRGDPCRRQERPVSQFFHCNPQNVSSLVIYCPPPPPPPPPLFISKSFSSAASPAATPAVVKSDQSHNSSILTHRMFRLFTSRPFPLCVSKSFSPAASAAATLAAVKSR